MAEQAVIVMMVKNEAENIERALRSVEGLWHRYVIGIDDMTTDDTEALVRRWMQGREDQGIIQPFTWPKSFADARNLHMELALQTYPECQWLISLDGDDVLCPYSRGVIEAWLEKPHPDYDVLNSFVHLDPDEHGIPFMMYPRAVLLRNRPEIRWKYAAHNVIQCPSERQLLIQQLVVIHKQAPLKRAMREAQRIEQNIPNLEQQAETDGEARALFYLGNSLLDAQRYAEAEAVYHQYLERSDWPDERYQALLHLAALRFHAGDNAGAKAFVWDALRCPGQWNRAEAYMHLGDCALHDGEVGEALHWFSIAGEMPPPVSSLFLQGHIYTYLPHWRLALLFDAVGQYDKALSHAKRAYTWRPSPDIRAACEALEQVVAEQPRDEASGGLVPQALQSGLPMATAILPLPEAELERLLAEIPVGAHA